MIGSLQGRVVERSPQQVLVDVAGVGYLVHVPLSTFYELEKAGDGVVRLLIHTHVREDAIELFGFWTAREKQLFQKLIAVSGIGPRLAQVVLSGMSAQDLARALAGGDVARLTTIPGIGKKTAERMVVELRDKVAELAAEAAAESSAAPALPADNELVAALVNLGYKLPQAERAVAQTRQELPDAAFHELLRASLRRLARL